MKGIVLAGGTGSRLWPITKGASKQLLPIYDKPLIHYPIGTLMLAGIRDIFVITTPEDAPAFKRLLGGGSEIGVNFQYGIQESPRGIGEAFVIAENFIGDDEVALILGDNLFHGHGLGTQLKEIRNIHGAEIFAYSVSDPERYGVVEFDESGIAKSIEEKPSRPKSSFAIPGLYFFDNSVIEIARNTHPSARGEIEITTINQTYLEAGSLRVRILPRGTMWLDTGTVESLNAASNYVKIIEERQGQKISCLEEISWRNKWISDSELEKIAAVFRTNEYGNYLSKLVEGTK
jgi:glucose-1-phosphate thymidylyltransferase